MISRLLFWLKASRPGLWFQTIWLYLLAVAGTEAHKTTIFWVGFFWVTFPLNLLIYGWNDIVDEEIDRLNPRKDSYLFGARGTHEQLATLPLAIMLVNLPFFVVMIGEGGFDTALVLAGIVFANWIYNLPKYGLRGQPPLELLNEVCFLLVIPVGSLLNHLPWPPTATFVYLYLFIVHAHLIGEVMDIVPDRAGGRRTTATLLGMKWTKIVIIVLVALESCIILMMFRDYLLGGFLVGCIVWLLLDLLVIFKERIYRYGEMKLLGIAMNVAGFSSMIWVWWTASLSKLAET